MEIYFSLLILCFVTVHSRSVIPEPPSVRIGPFDLINNKTEVVSPQGDDQEEGYDEKKLFQGDIKHSGIVNKTEIRIGAAGTRTPWPKGIIPYVFDCSVESMESALQATQEAMAEWESRTCIRFVKKQPHHKVYLEFIRAAGCWATYVGYKGRKTQISIGNGCDYKHVMVHELGHVIGFWHEQSRPDRDQYITINKGNVYRSLLYNFDIVKEQVNNYGEPYDFDSIMHYPWNAFAIDKRYNTILPKNRAYLSSKKPYRKLSDSDVAQTNKMYQCGKVAAARDSRTKYINEQNNVVNAASFTEGECRDNHVNCPSWAKADFCELSPDPVLKTCPKSCGLCGKNKPFCADDYDDCKGWAEYEYCVKKDDLRIMNFMLKSCRKTCGVCTQGSMTKPTTLPTTTALPPTTTPDPTTTAPTTAQIMTTPRPVTTKPTSNGEIRAPTKKFRGVLCKDRSKYCQAWANDGRCETDRWVYDNCMLSCKRFTICDKNMIKPIGECTNLLGVNSVDKEIPNDKMYATSSFAPGGGWYAPAYSGRLYKEDDHVRKHVGAWCAHPYGKKDDYLQIDFGSKKNITALATQGRDVYFEHVKSYSLSFSDDRSTWREYQESGVKKVFDGNCDHVTPVLNILRKAEYARFIRIHPIKYIGAACLRVEVYGC